MWRVLDSIVRNLAVWKLRRRCVVIMLIHFPLSKTKKKKKGKKKKPKIQDDVLH